MAKWAKDKRDAWVAKNREKINARRRELRSSRKEEELAKRRAYRAKNRDRINAWQRAHRCAKLGIVRRECVCEICGAKFTTARKVQHTCGASECKAELQRRNMRAKYSPAKRSDRNVSEKLRKHGITEADAVAVIAAQDSGDRERLWKESQAWSTAQRKFAKKRYMALHGMSAFTTCGDYGFGKGI